MLTIYLDEDTTLSVVGLRHVYVENSELVFENFDHAIFRWKHYGGGPDAPYNEKNYFSGQVRFVPPVGTIVKLE